jgi:hypothetical protein
MNTIRCRIYVFAGLLCLAVSCMGQKVDCSVCNAALAKDEASLVTSNEEACAVLSLIDQDNYEKAKAGGALGVTIPIEGIPIDFSGSYQQFNESRQKYFQQVGYTASSKSNLNFHTETTNQIAYQYWSKCMEDCIKGSPGGGFSAWKTYEDENKVSITLYFVGHGDQTKMTVASSSLAYGAVTGLRKGQIVRQGTKLNQNAELNIDINRTDKSHPMVATINPKGWGSVTLVSEWIPKATAILHIVPLETKEVSDGQVSTSALTSDNNNDHRGGEPRSPDNNIKASWTTIVLTVPPGHYLRNVSEPKPLQPPDDYLIVDAPLQYSDDKTSAKVTVRTWTVARQIQLSGESYHIERKPGAEIKQTIGFFPGKSFVVSVPDGVASAFLEVETTAGKSLAQVGKSSADGYVRLITSVPAQGSQNYQYEVLKAAQPLSEAQALAEVQKLRPVEKIRIVPGDFKNADALLKAVQTLPAK